MAVMVRCPLVNVNTMFCSNRLSPACSASYCLGPCHRALACCPSRARESTNDDDGKCNSSLVLPGLGSSVLQYASLASVAHELPLFAAKKAVLVLSAQEGQGHLPSINFASPISMAHDKASPRKASTTFAVSAGSSSALHNDFLI